ncbi:hypothetical protein FHT02_004288 [Sphingomonas xinjiangensis]|uniref:Uncharacterized protein n=1 Tax=Sphingomonas xinjiangensis TaxID=643568 RepID=A0A840YTI1_9SPHN|nr:hypothetical protein [Sphingomonas xinjiangensis]
MLLYASLLVGAQTAPSVPQSPPCRGTSGLTATRLTDLPAGIRSILPAALADADGPFHVSDGVGPGEEDWPFVRLTCGYSIPQGYIVELERGGRGHSFSQIAFQKTATGYRLR